MILSILYNLIRHTCNIIFHLVFYTVQVTSMLQLVRMSCRTCPAAGALFMDELATVVKNGNVDPQIEVLILI